MNTILNTLLYKNASGTIAAKNGILRYGLGEGTAGEAAASVTSIPGKEQECLSALCRAIFKAEEVNFSIFTFLNEMGGPNLAEI